MATQDLSEIESASDLDVVFEEQLKLTPTSNSDSDDYSINNAVPPRKRRKDDSDYSEEEKSAVPRQFTVTESIMSVPKITFYPRYAYVILPEKATPGSAGFDVFMSRKHRLKPGLNKVMFEFGLKIPKNSVGLIRERSSGAMRSIITHAGVIDYDFHSRNDLQIIFENMSKQKINLKRGTSVAQLLLLPLMLAEVKVHIAKAAIVDKTGKLTRGFGSTGNTPAAPEFDENKPKKARSRHFHERNWPVPVAQSSGTTPRKPRVRSPPTPITLSEDESDDQEAAKATKAAVVNLSKGSSRKRPPKALKEKNKETVSRRPEVFSEPRRPVHDRLGWEPKQRYGHGKQIHYPKI